MYPLDYSKRIYCLITGASRGIGRTIAVELASRASNITLVLLARSDTGLQETKALILNSNKNANVISESIDLAKADGFHFEKIIQKTFSSAYDTAIIFHNAGQIGSIQRASELSNKDLWQNYYDLNIISVTVLNSIFVKIVKTKLKNIFVINITSAVGRKVFKYLSMYGSGKAARDLYFKVFAEEEPELVVLNYSPGMVETSMANELVENIKSFEDSEINAALQTNPNKLTPKQTTIKMLMLLEKAEFRSGDIIDYYD